MADPCDHDHDHPAPSAGALGIPRSGGFDGPAFEQAIADLLRACGVAPDGAHTGKTPQRVRELWERRLLGGYALDPAQVLGEGFADPRQDMVVVRGIAVHGVCPHHLVPFRGTAHRFRCVASAWRVPAASCQLTCRALPADLGQPASPNTQREPPRLPPGFSVRC